jgi:hypothetical protein
LFAFYSKDENREHAVVDTLPVLQFEQVMSLPKLFVVAEIFTIDSPLETSARLEGRTLARIDFHRLACLRVKTLTGRSLSNPERAESTDRDFVTFCKRRLDCRKDGSYCVVRLRVGETRFLRNGAFEVIPSHASSFRSTSTGFA